MAQRADWCLCVRRAVSVLRQCGLTGVFVCVELCQFYAQRADWCLCVRRAVSVLRQCGLTSVFVCVELCQFYGTAGILVSLCA